MSMRLRPTGRCANHLVVDKASGDPRPGVMNGDIHLGDLSKRQEVGLVDTALIKEANPSYNQHNVHHGPNHTS